MKPLAKYTTLLLSLLIGMALTPHAGATPSAAPHSRTHLAQLGDPYVPPRVRAAARTLVAAPATAGASLQTQALGLLRQQFDQADLNHTGRVTKVQAGQTGFGFVVHHFEQIDARHRGSVTFGDLKAFMRANGAKF